MPALFLFPNGTTLLYYQATNCPVSTQERSAFACDSGLFSQIACDYTGRMGKRGAGVRGCDASIVVSATT